MKNPANSNIYEANARSVLEAYAGFVEGAPESLLLAVSGAMPTDDAREALASSAERLGFRRSIAWLRLRPESSDAPTLGADDLFAIVEGLDPIALVALDAPSCRLLADAYRCDVPQDAPCRIFGRNAAAFHSFESMLGSNELKQKAWSILKRLA